MNRLSMRAAQQGMTLIEILVAMALMGLVTTAIVNVNISSTRASAMLQTRNDLLPESQISQNYVLSRLREATYVFPKGTVFTGNSDVTLQNPNTGTTTWTVGTDPIVAVVLPPSSKTPSCPLTAPAAPDTANCYTFYAYYPVLRRTLTSQTNALSPSLRPPADAANDANAWVLMEYRASYGAVTTATPRVVAADGSVSGTSASSIFTGAPASPSQGRIVMDYLLPVTTPQSSTVADRLFDQVGDTSQAPGSTNIVVNLAAKRVFAGQTIRLPSSGRYSVAVYPRNVGKTILNNP